MRNLQEILREAKSKELQEQFCSKYGPNKQFEKYYERLTHLEIEVVPEGEDSVFVAVKEYIGGAPEVSAELYQKQDILTKGINAKSAGYEYVRQEIILGCKVYESQLFRNYKYEVLADILYEMSFFGYKQERLEEEIELLKTAVKEAEEGNTITMSLEELFADFDDDGKLLPTVKYEKEDELLDNIREAERRYNAYCRSIELEQAIREFSGEEQAETFANAIWESWL